MKRAIIYYFTGTFNTRIIASLIKKELEDNSISTELFDIRVPFQKIPDPNDYDFIGFGYPIHAFNAPQFFQRFVKSLPSVSKKNTFIFRTSGEPFRFNNASSFSLIRILKKKGYNPILDEQLLMPYNIWFRYPKEIVKFMYKHNLKLTKVIVKDFLEEKHLIKRFNPLTVIFMYISRFQWFGAKVNGPLIHVNKSICTKCGLCVKNCPSGNIKFKKDYPSFYSKCTMCMSCVSICPVDAVRPGILNGWRVNGGYDFLGYVEDESIPDIQIDESTKGYFKLFRKYYKKTNNRIKQYQNK